MEVQLHLVLRGKIQEGLSFFLKEDSQGEREREKERVRVCVLVANHSLVYSPNICILLTS